MNFYLPDHRAFFCAENATHTLHNTLTLRGALVRDPRIWAHYLNQAIEEFGARLRRAVRLPSLAALGHRPDRRPTSPSSATCTATCTTRPLRLINQGYTGNEIAEIDHAAAEPGGRVALPRLLRVGQPQRQGRLPALHGLVRRQPRAPVGAPARRVGRALRRLHGRQRRGPRAAPAPRSTTATSAGSRRSSTTSSSPTPTTPPPANCRPTRSNSSATAPRTPPGATSSSTAPRSSATASSGTPTSTASAGHASPT